MEHILIAVFGGGIDDWKDIIQTRYNWEEIYKQIKDKYGTENISISINDFYVAILEQALYELETLMKNYKGKVSEEFEKCREDISNYFDIWCNYSLDTRISFIGNEELGKEIQEKLQDEIDKIDEKIGFTYISFE